jgi:hypothetical protein
MNRQCKGQQSQKYPDTACSNEPTLVPTATLSIKPTAKPTFTRLLRSPLLCRVWIPLGTVPWHRPQ